MLPSLSRRAARSVRPRASPAPSAAAANSFNGSEFIPATESATRTAAPEACPAWSFSPANASETIPTAPAATPAATASRAQPAGPDSAVVIACAVAIACRAETTARTPAMILGISHSTVPKATAKAVISAAALTAPASSPLSQAIRFVSLSAMPSIAGASLIVNSAHSTDTAALVLVIASWASSTLAASSRLIAPPILSMSCAALEIASGFSVSI